MRKGKCVFVVMSGAPLRCRGYTGGSPIGTEREHNEGLVFRSQRPIFPTRVREVQLISDITITNEAAYKEWADRIVPTFAQFGAKFLVRGGLAQLLCPSRLTP
jgi:Domain of unknown function (DUF1330)